MPRPRTSSVTSSVDGTTRSAASLGVSARTSATRSASVTSISWPIAETVGTSEAAIARTLAEQRAGEPFLPVFLTRHPDFSTLREQRLAFEYFPFELDEAAPAPEPRWAAYLTCTLELTLRRWGVRQIVTL